MTAVVSHLSPLCATCPLQRLVLEQAERIAELEKINAALTKKIAELEAKLAKYENAHTPPSQKFVKPKSKGTGRLGRPHGYEGTTRPTREPDRVVAATAKECPRCHSPLGEPVRIESRIIEEIPEPKPLLIIEFKVAHYECKKCGEHVVGTHPELPKEGRFGPRALAHITLLKYSSRLPHEKVCEVLEREFGLSITPATVLDITRRVSDSLKEEYEAIRKRIREAGVVYVDETGIRVSGSKYWIWVFTTDTDTLVVIRHSRGKNVLKEVLGKKFHGIIVCDGHRSYSNFTSNLQRCWAHILREAKFVAEQIEEAAPLSEALHKLYKRLTDFMATGPPDGRERMHRNALATLRYWLGKNYANERVAKFVAKVKTGEKHLLTFVLHPGVEPTNNRAERALREHVVIRKIIGTLRNEKGTRIHETVMSCLATWEQRGLNPYSEIIKQVS